MRRYMGHSCKPFGVDAALAETFSGSSWTSGPVRNARGPISGTQRSPSYIGKRFSLESS